VFTPFALSFSIFALIQGFKFNFLYIPVKKLEHFELKKEHAVFCPVGQASFDEKWLT
jgi:hypothetical protein